MMSVFGELMPVSAAAFSDVAGSLLKLESQEEEELLDITSFAKGSFSSSFLSLHF